MRNFRTNSIKDSIRRGHDDLGDHYLDAGDFFNAVRCYVRSRDYCVTPRHMITMCMNVIKASFYMQNWSNVLSYVSKAEQAIESLESTAKSATTPSASTSMINPMEVSSASTTNATVASDAVLASRLKVYAGIAELATKRYKLAARHFLGVSFDHCSNHFQVGFALFHSLKYLGKDRVNIQGNTPTETLKSFISLINKVFFRILSHLKH